MQNIIFATNNRHKLCEIQDILGQKFHVKGLQDIGVDEDIPETGTTLAENASLKSKFVQQRFKSDCFSDDTGLEVDALDGRPGVYSARFAGEEGNAEKNIKKLLAELTGVKDRKARFRTVISLIYKGDEYFFEGTVEGQIISRKRGEEGFGYDPVFLPDGYNQTFAEMPLEEKNKISHRARAVRRLAEFLKSQ